MMKKTTKGNTITERECITCWCKFNIDDGYSEKFCCSDCAETYEDDELEEE